MKQTINLEQERLLVDNQIIITAQFDEFTRVGSPKTIGELIEWIEINVNELRIKHKWMGLSRMWKLSIKNSKMKITSDELIDGLVELAVRIKTDDL